MKKVILSLFLILASFGMEASHYLGGELSWRCKSNGQYVFTLRVYRDCTGANFSRNIDGSTETVTGGPTGITLYLRQINDITPVCSGGAGLKRCDQNPTNAGGDQGAVEEFVYTNDPAGWTKQVGASVVAQTSGSATTFPNQAPPTAGWTFTNQLPCCRPGSVNVSGSSGRNMTVRAKMYPYTPAGAIAPLTANPCYDGSPRFIARPASIICEGYKFTYNQLASDTEVDSLSYKWDMPTSSAGNLIFNSGFSMSAPFPDQTENVSNGPVTLDATTGQITVEAYNVTQGNYISNVKVEAWKDCQLKAEIWRDFPIVFRNDASCSANNPPTAEIDTAIYDILTRTGDNYTTRLYPGDTVKFEMQASDFDVQSNGLFQTITFVAVNDELSVPYGSGTGCISGKTPCATIDPVAPQTNYVSQQNNNIFFEWVPSCAHLSTSSGCKGKTNLYPFSLRMVDNGCPANAIGVTTILIEVVTPTPNTPPIKCVSYTDPGFVDVSWIKPELDSGLFFNHYLVSGSSSPNGPFVPLDTVADSNTLSTIISGQNTAPYYYYVQMNMSPRDRSCNFYSMPSDTLSLMSLSLTALPPNNSEVAVLSWTPISTPYPRTKEPMYEVWGEVPINSANWIKFAETSTLNFSDTVTVCDDTIRYQVRVYDTSRTCYSSSTTEFARFSDQTNDDIITIDSVTVDASGLANISWDSSRSGDVIAYYILMNDPVTGWTYIDTVAKGDPLPYVWANSQAETRSEQFRVISVDSCDNQSDDQVVVAHNTIRLRSYINKCDGFIRLSWNGYSGFPGGVAGYNLLQQTTDLNGVTSNWNLLRAGTPSDTTFNINTLIKGWNYCFRVQAVDTSGFVTSRSNIQCEQASVPQKSRLLYISRVTNNEIRGSLDLQVFLDGQADVVSFNIERAQEQYGRYTTIGVVNKPASAPFKIDYSDYTADTDFNQYYYRITASDSCGGKDTISNLGSNIVLRVMPESDVTNSLVWNPYKDFGGNVDRYEVYRSINDNLSYSLVGTNDGSDTTFIDDVSQYGEENGEFCYYVKAVEGANPLGFTDENGQAFSSLSNQVCVNQRARVFLPSAFRPGSEVLENQFFGPSLRFEEIESYSFYVVNRWGATVFETSDPERKWDGTYKGQPADQGVYIYHIKYSTANDVPREDRGSFTLIR